MNKHHRAPGRVYQLRMGARPAPRWACLAARAAMAAVLLFGMTR